MIYAYYGNKEQLYTAVLDEVYSRMADKEKELLNRELDCEEMIKCVIQHYFSFLHETPAFVRMVMWKNLNEAKYLKQSNARNMLAPQSSFMEKAENGIKNGVFREDLNIPETIISINMFCFFIFFKQIYYD